MKRIQVWGMCFAMAAGMATALYGGKGDAARGKEVFEQCAMCHNADSAEKKQGPGLKGLFKRDKLSNGKKATEANIRQQIDDGSSSGMPAYKELLDDQQKDDLIAYLKTL